MTSSDKEYKFDTLLITEDIKYIDRIIASMHYEDVRCDRCNAQLRYVNLLRIDTEHYNIGDNCYQSIKNKLSELWETSLHDVRIRLEQGYQKYLRRKYAPKTQISVDPIDKGPGYSRYLEFKWDDEHGGLHPANILEYEKLKKRFG